MKKKPKKKIKLTRYNIDKTYQELGLSDPRRIEYFKYLARLGEPQESSTRQWIFSHSTSNI